MISHIVSEDTPLPASVLQQIANTGCLDEISNIPGSVRFHLFHNVARDRANNKLRRPVLFFVYQTTRHGPQNGFRLCIVYQGFQIPSEHKSDEDPEDDIDRLERPIPQGHMEVVILGDRTHKCWPAE